MKVTTTFLILVTKFWSLFPIVFFILVELVYINKPSLYMDAVNPDYLATWLLRGGVQIPSWTWPDNIIFGKNNLPLLNSLYGGNLTAYLWALFSAFFGFGSSSVHIFHICLGVGLLLALRAALTAWKINRIYVFLAGLALALNINYLLSWRTQYYLQLFATIFFLIGIYLYGKSIHSEDLHLAKRLRFIALVFFGFSAYQYFILFFYGLPFVFLIKNRERGGYSLKTFITNFAFFFLGWLPFIYAHLSILIQSGISRYIQLLLELQNFYGVVETSNSFQDRIVYTFSRANGVIFGNAVSETVFNYSEYLNLGFIIFSLAVSGLGFAFLRFSGVDLNSSHLVKNLVFGLFLHLAFSICLGNTLYTQHFVMMLPILSITLAGLANAHLKPRMKFNQLGNKTLFLALIMIIMPAIISIGFYEHRLLDETNRTEAYNSDISLVTLALGSPETGDSIIFPQWGYWMGYAVTYGPNRNIFAEHSLEYFRTVAAPGKYPCVNGCTIVVHSNVMEDKNSSELLNSGLRNASLEIDQSGTRVIGSVILYKLKILN